MLKVARGAFLEADGGRSAYVVDGKMAMRREIETGALERRRGRDRPRTQRRGDDRRLRYDAVQREQHGTHCDKEGAPHARDEEHQEDLPHRHRSRRTRSRISRCSVKRGGVRVGDRSVGIGEDDLPQRRRAARHVRLRHATCSTARTSAASPTGRCRRSATATIGFVFQSFNLIPDLNVFDNVDVPLRYRGLGAADRKQRIERSLEMVGLSARTPPSAVAALRRPAAARGHRPRPGRRSEADPRRRADRQPRLRS